MLIILNIILWLDCSLNLLVGGSPQAQFSARCAYFSGHSINSHSAWRWMERLFDWAYHPITGSKQCSSALKSIANQQDHRRSSGWNLTALAVLLISIPFALSIAAACRLIAMYRYMGAAVFVLFWLLSVVVSGFVTALLQGGGPLLVFTWPGAFLPLYFAFFYRFGSKQETPKRFWLNISLLLLLSFAISSLTGFLANFPD